MKVSDLIKLLSGASPSDIIENNKGEMLIGAITMQTKPVLMLSFGEIKPKKLIDIHKPLVAIRLSDGLHVPVRYIENKPWGIVTTWPDEFAVGGNDCWKLDGTDVCHHGLWRLENESTLGGILNEALGNRDTKPEPEVLWTNSGAKYTVIPHPLSGNLKVAFSNDDYHTVVVIDGIGHRFHREDPLVAAKEMLGPDVLLLIGAAGRDSKIATIKHVRSITGLGLTLAKKLVEELMERR